MAADYFRKRERAERAAAKKAVAGPARRAHQELAKRYAELARQSSAGGVLANDPSGDDGVAGRGLTPGLRIF